MSDIIKKTTFINKVLGTEIPVQVPDTCEGIDTLAGTPGTAWSMAIRFGIYHIWNVKFRSALCDALVEKTGVPIPQKQENGKPVFKKGKDNEGNEIPVPVLVSEQAYVNHLLGNNHISEEDLQALAKEVAEEVPFELNVGRAIKANTKNKKDAAVLCAAFDSGDKDPDEFVKRWEELNGKSFSAECGSEVNVESVALALRINDDRKLREKDF